MSSFQPAPQPPSAADEAPATQVLALVADALRARRLAEVEELRLAIRWATIQGHPRDDRDPMVSPGGDGTPEVREHAIPELAMARETHPATTRALIADGLDLVHRLPRTWAVVEAGGCEPWVARKVAVLSRALLDDRVRAVDRAVAKAIAGHAPSTVLEIARAKVIEADPETHRAEQERERHRRYVSLSRADEFGYRHVIARVGAGDAAWIDAMVERVAEILSATMGHDHNHDELRSIAMGWLARPLDLLKLLLEHTDTTTGEVPAWASDHLAETVARITTMPARRLAQLGGRGRLFVHVTDEALRTGVGVARIEGAGPIDVRQLREVLGHADVTVTPVLDPAQRHPRRRRLRPRRSLRRHRATGADRPPQLRSAAPAPPPHQDPRRPHHPGRRSRTTSLAHAPPAGVPRRPHRHHPADRRPGRVDGPGDRRRGRALLQLLPVTL